MTLKRLVVSLAVAVFSAITMPALGSQHGGGSSSSGTVGGGHGNATRSTVARGNGNMPTGGGRQRTAAPATRGRQSATTQHQAAPLPARTPRFGFSVNDARAGFSSQRPNVSMAPAPTNHILVRNYYDGGYGRRGYHHYGSWWGGGFWFGYSLPAGYYYLPLVPGYVYWNQWYGYRFFYGERGERSGIKFVLDEIPKKDQKAVRHGSVYLLDQEGKRGGSVGSVDDFMRSTLHLEPGIYDLAIIPAQKDMRRIDVSVRVLPGRPTHVHLTFTEPLKDAQNVVDQNQSDGNTGEDKPVRVPDPDKAWPRPIVSYN